MPRVEVNGVGLQWESVGEGEPVVLLNGVMMTAQSWAFQTAALRSRFRCILHDFRGQLLSDKPLEPWSMEDHAIDLLGLLDRLEIERCHLVGTSYGGEVGLIFAAGWPERVKSLSVISSVSEIDPDLRTKIRRWRRATAEAPETLYRVSRPDNFSARFAAEQPEMLELGEQRLAACPPEFFRAFVGLLDAFLDLDVTADLARIHCPTLVIVGERDALKPPRWSRLIASRIPDSELVVVPGAGHAVILERPDEVNGALIDFLRRHTGSG